KGPVRIFEAVDTGDMRMVQRGENLGFSAETAMPVRIGRDQLRQNFERHVTIELRVTRAIHLTHTAGANRGQNFVRSEACTGREGHRDVPGLYPSVSAGLPTHPCSGLSVALPPGMKRILQGVSLSALLL